jgi:hypothetical protein
VRSPGSGEARSRRTLRFDKPASGKNRFAISESIPEHDYTVPAKYVYEIHSGGYLDDK